MIDKAYNLETFTKRCKEVSESDAMEWEPKGLVLHCTGAPKLNDRLNGYNPQHMANYRTYYNSLGWSGGPHIMIDDKGQIWELNTLLDAGVHAPSWNHTHFGLEMLGNFNPGVDDFNSGRGLLVHQLAIKTMAIMFDEFELSISELKFHRDDPKSSHKACPGAFVKSEVIIAELTAALTELQGK